MVNTEAICMGEFSYHEMGHKQVSIARYLGDNAEVVIPETLAGMRVCEIGEEAFANNRIIEYVTMPNTIEVIGNKAFYSCRNLREVRMSNNLKIIGACAFAECESLREIKILHRLDKLCENAFTLSGLEYIEFVGATEWETDSFSLCSKLSTVKLKNIDYIPDGCFLHDIYLERVISDKQILRVADSAFKGCRRFREILIEDWVSTENRQELPAEKMIRRKRAYSYARVILINSDGLERELIMKKAKQLYEYLHEHVKETRAVSSILPEEVSNDILAGKLPKFPHEDVGIAVSDEDTIHYIEHAIFYKEVGDEQFTVSKGKLYIFSDKIIYNGGIDNFEILISDIEVAIQYVGKPEIIELVTNNNTIYLEVPTPSVLFSLLDSLDTKNEKETELVEVSTTLETMIEAAELDSYIFYFEDVQHSKIDDNLKEQVGILIDKLHNLNSALEKHPDNIEGAHRFSTYYLPETLRLIFSYQQYLAVGVSEERIAQVHDKIIESIDAVIIAVDKKVDDIYKIATMDTVAKANALQKIIGQDGYIKGEGQLKH